MRAVNLSIASLFITVVLAASAQTARAECNCVAIAGDVSAAIQAEVAKADGLYARGDFDGALAIYARVHASSKEPSLLYAQAMAKWQLGASAEAKALFQQYLSAGGTLAYRDRAEASLGKIGAGVSATAGAAGGVAGGIGGGLRGGVEGVEGGVRGGADLGAGAVGGVAATAQGKVKVGKKAGIVLGVIAIAAIGVVGVHSIAAGLKDDIELDAKFDLGLGITGVAVGITAIYVAGLTAATGAAGAACTPGLASLPAKKPIVAPYATRGGGGIAAAMTF
jgi:hypothetical protein